MIRYVVTCQQAGGHKVMREFKSQDDALSWASQQRATGWRCGLTGYRPGKASDSVPAPKTGRLEPSQAICNRLVVQIC